MSQYKIFTLSLLLIFISNENARADFIFEQGFENFSTPNTEQDIARFLTQSTYGVAPQDITDFGAMTYEQWIDQQQALPATTHRDELESIVLERGPQGFISQDTRRQLWNRVANTAPDQLRQRMAFALSQMFVISEQENNNRIRVTMMAEFYDHLVRGAFGNFRDLLEEVSLSPAMGFYLTHLRNRKKELVNPVTNSYILPDENFAREVMQLFSIGIFERNLDFSLKDGEPQTAGTQAIETYDQNIVTNLARVMTGYGFQCSGPETISNGNVSLEIASRDCAPGVETLCQGVHCNFNTAFFSLPFPAASSLYNGLYHPDIYKPLVCYPRFHDTGWDSNGNPNPLRPLDPPYLDEPYDDKRIIGHLPDDQGGTLPMSAEECDSLHNIPDPTTNQLQRMQMCVDYCDSELDQALDALFYHQNTAPMVARFMIQRFITSNPSSGYIRRVAETFVDNGSGIRGDMAAVIKTVLLDYEARSDRFKKDDYFGKLREPLLKLTAFYRGMETITSDPEQLNWGPAQLETTLGDFGQGVMAANSVFNFYQPDYQKPGEITDKDLYSPEFQILNANTVISGQNTFHLNVCNGYGTLSNSNPPFRNSNCAGGNDGSAFGFFPPENSAYIPAEVLEGLPDDFEAMVEALNLRLLYGNMSGTFTPPTGMKGIFKNRIEGPMAGFDKKLIAISMIQVILASPEFAVQLYLGQAMAAQSGGFNDYKAIVCLELNGGSDSFNMLTPRDSTQTNSHYDTYLNSRGGLYTTGSGVAYDFNDLLPINSSSSGANGATVTDGDYGLNPEFYDRPHNNGSTPTPGIQSLYDQGELAFLANVGTLSEPLTKTEFLNDLKAVPQGVGSHSDQRKLWNVAGPYERDLGWGGNTIGEILNNGSDNQVFPPCISIAGNNLFQTGQVANNNEPITPYIINSGGATPLRFFSGSDPKNLAYLDVYNASYSSILAREYKNSFTSARDFANVFNDLLSQGAGSTAAGDGWGRINTPYQSNGVFDPVNNRYPTARSTVGGLDLENSLLNQLQMVARLIKISRNPDAGINATRQVYFVSLPGFDTHAAQMTSEGFFKLMANLSQATGYFSEAMKEIGAENEVTLFTSSEFGRKLAPNGTMPIWTGIMMVADTFLRPV